MGVWNRSPRLLNTLNQQYTGRVNVYAHSMGGIVASEALRIESESASPSTIINVFVPTQAASVAHAYAAFGPEVTETDATTQTPEVYGDYPPTGLPYFEEIDQVAVEIVNFHNLEDFALGLPWELNQDTKPDPDYSYDAGAGTWEHDPGSGPVPLTFPSDRYQIYSHIAEARSKAVGAAVYPPFTVPAPISYNVDLNAAPHSYGSGDEEHSAQFRATNMMRHHYWTELLNAFGVTVPPIPAP